MGAIHRLRPSSDVGSGTSQGAPTTNNPPDTRTSGANNAGPDNRTADQILKDMAAAYRKSTSYADNGQVRRRFERNGQPLEQVFDFSVAFVRPNKLRLICYDAMAVCDGKQFRAAVKTIPNRVMQVSAPETLTPEFIVNDPQLRAALQGPGGAPVQIAFLMTDNTIAQLLQDVMSPPKLLQPEPIDGRRCNRVEIDGSQGMLTLWIDQQSNLLRRIELPTKESKQELDQDGPVNNVALSIEFANSQVNEKVNDNAFVMEVPEGAKVGPTLVEEVAPAPISPATEPAALKLTKLWTAEGIKDPGNLLVVDGADGKPRLLAIDGWRVVAELDEQGKVVTRHELDIPDNAVVNYLRTAVDGQGKRYFVASGNGQAQFFVFDENWKKVLAFPKPEDGAAEGVWDVQIADLKGDGKPQLFVGYWGDVGVQGVALDGNRLWRDRSIQFVFRLATTEPDASGRRHLLATHNRGTIASFDADGKAEKEIAIPNRNVYYLVADDLDHSGNNSYCGLAGTASGENTALGIALDGRELWNYTLPPGVHGRPVEVITSGDIAGDGNRDWLLAGPDGSIHILAADGKPIDKFNTGSALGGMSATKIGDQRVLLLSKVFDKPDGDAKGTLEAWVVEPTSK